MLRQCSVGFLQYKSAIPNESGQAATMLNSSNPVWFKIKTLKSDTSKIKSAPKTPAQYAIRNFSGRAANLPNY